MRRILRVMAGAAVLISMMLVSGAGTASAASHDDRDASSYKHIFVIMMENHATNQIFGNTADAPFINQLASRYAIATN